MKVNKEKKHAFYHFAIYGINHWVIFLGGLCEHAKEYTLIRAVLAGKLKVVIAHYKAPEPGMTVSGHQGLLDMAITEMVNNKIINRLKKSNLSWYPELADQFAQQL